MRTSTRPMVTRTVGTASGLRSLGRAAASPRVLEAISLDAGSGAGMMASSGESGTAWPVDGVCSGTVVVRVEVALACVEAGRSILAAGRGGGASGAVAWSVGRAWRCTTGAGMG